MRKYKCSKCGGKEFYVTAHVTQGWIADENGEWSETTEECVEVTHSPDDDDVWTCTSCGYDAAGGVMREDANG